MRSTLWAVWGLSLMTVTAVWAQPMAAPGADVPGPMAAPPVGAVPVAPAPRRGTPQQLLEEDVRAFFSLLNGKRPVGAPEREDEVVNFYELSPYVAGVRDGYYGANEWWEWWPHFRGEGIDLIEFKIVEDKGLDARVKLVYRYKPPRVSTLWSEEWPLRWNGDNQIWQFVPEVPDESEALFAAPLHWAIYMVAQPSGALPRFRAALTWHNLKSLALGVHRFTQDWDERYAFEPEFVEAALRPYLEDDSLWIVPGTTTHYRFNARLSGKSEADVNEIARTVLFYEGNDEKPVLRYGGKAAIGFLDGHVKLVDAKELEGLRWEP